MSTRFATIAALAAVTLAVPASAQAPREPGIAQSEAECQGLFRTADTNGDGVLSPSEISEARPLIPTQLSGREDISQEEFLTACRNSVHQRDSY
jgi:Ca2+-binding EF-hand superfamily protein